MTLRLAASWRWPPLVSNQGSVGSLRPGPAGMCAQTPCGKAGAAPPAPRASSTAARGFHGTCCWDHVLSSVRSVSAQQGAPDWVSVCFWSEVGLTAQEPLQKPLREGTVTSHGRNLRHREVQPLSQASGGPGGFQDPSAPLLLAGQRSTLCPALSSAGPELVLCLHLKSLARRSCLPAPA